MTLTTKIRAFKPAGSDTVDRVVDLNNNLDLIDSNIGRIICTSTTKPTGTALYAGCLIYETDTTARRVYDGTSWITETQPVPTAGGVTIVKFGSVEIASGQSFLTTNASGQVQIANVITAACGWTNVYQFVILNGDSAARANLVFGQVLTGFPIASSAITVWTGNTGAVLVSLSFRVSWIAFGGA